MAFGVGGFIVGVYGMNLLNGYENQPTTFYIVISYSVCLISGFVGVGVVQLLKYRRIRLQKTKK